ncbi:DUF2628 domain-containing protein [Rhodococcus sp. NPDC058521]|uniref:DUF2628 domain-containing protein n=1 Tax=Rhodococcus sp. NPDC058521 TaxID=3346536 RepID=UPI00365AE65E
MAHEHTGLTAAPAPVRSGKWQFRFGFFDTYGTPGWGKPDVEYAAALRALSFRDRIKITMNFCAAFFTVFYLLYLGLWRKAIVVLVVAVALGVTTVALNVPYGLDTAISMAWWIWIGMRTNIYYYERVAEGRKTWGL